MSEEVNPVVHDDDIDESGKLRKWSTGRKIKWIIWIVIIIAVALGFWHQHYMRSDNAIKAVFNDNKETFQTVADFMIENTSSEDATLRKGKRSVKTISSDKNCKEIKKQIEELERRNIEYIDCDGLTVTFYTIYDCYYVYTSPLSSAGGEGNLGDGWWSYVKTSKS